LQAPANLRVRRPLLSEVVDLSLEVSQGRESRRVAALPARGHLRERGRWARRRQCGGGKGAGRGPVA
jgi:hypothetical protein